MLSYKKLENQKFNTNVENCYRYVELLENKCDNQKALQFSQKKFCHYDSTKKLEGPKNFRILKVSYNKNYTENGWIKGTPVFSNNKPFLKKLSLKENNTYFTQYFNQNIVKTDNKKKGFEKKLNIVKTFYKQMEDKYKLKGLNKKEILNKLNKIKIENKSEFTNESNKKKFPKIINKKFKFFMENLKDVKKKFSDIKNYQKYVETIFTNQNEVLKNKETKTKTFTDNIFRNQNLIEEFNSCFYLLPIPQKIN
jgi:hypothetical protein